MDCDTYINKTATQLSMILPKPSMHFSQCSDAVFPERMLMFCFRMNSLPVKWLLVNGYFSLTVAVGA